MVKSPALMLEACIPVVYTGRIMSELREEEEIGLAVGSNGFPAPDHEGGLVCVAGEFPSWLSVEEVSEEYHSLQRQLQAVHEPPVASIMPLAEESAGIRDYRAFAVEFQAGATPQHIFTAMQLTMDAIRRLREERE